MKLRSYDGRSVLKAEREQRQALWLESCKSAEAELGRCTPDNVSLYRVRLDALESSLPPEIPEIDVEFPATSEALKELLSLCGAHAFVFSLHDCEVVCVTHV